MAHKNRSSGRPSGPNSPQDEVVRLPVPERELNQQLEAMPAPKRVTRLQPAPQVDLMEDEAEENGEANPVDLGVGWEAEAASTVDQSTPMGWLVLIGLFLLLLGGWGLARLAKGEAHTDALADQIRAEQDQVERERLAALDPPTRAEDLTTKYLRAETVAAKLAFVRHPERVRPLMEDYYRRHELIPAQFEAINRFQGVGVGNYPFFLLAAKVKEEGKPRILFVEQYADGRLRFDWESEVGYQPMEIADYLEQKPTEPMDFRVYARLDTFLGYEFTDPDRYQPLKLSFRDTDEFLFGYIEKGTPQERGLTAFLERNLLVAQPVLLRLRFLPETQSRRSVLVEKVVAPRWVRIEEDLASDR